jgi:hypothetical protein
VIFFGRILPSGKSSDLLKGRRKRPMRRVQRRNLQLREVAPLTTASVLQPD